MAQLVKTNEEMVEVKPTNGKTFTLEELQNLIGGGYIEVLRTKDKIFIFDENGLNKDLDQNEVATALLYTELDGFNPIQVLVGDVVICDNNEIK